MFAWHSPAQLIESASWLKVTKEALAQERAAYASADVERTRLLSRVRELETQGSSMTPPPSTAPQSVGRGPIEHELKTWRGPFQAMKAGLKGFEYRKDDRDYREGDTLWLRETEDGGEIYTGDELRRSVTYCLRGPLFGVPAGYVIMSVPDPAPQSVGEVIERLKATIRYVTAGIGSGAGYVRPAVMRDVEHRIANVLPDTVAALQSSEAARTLAEGERDAAQARAQHLYAQNSYADASERRAEAAETQLTASKSRVGELEGMLRSLRGVARPVVGALDGAWSIVLASMDIERIDALLSPSQGGEG